MYRNFCKSLSPNCLSSRSALISQRIPTLRVQSNRNLADRFGDFPHTLTLYSPKYLSSILIRSGWRIDNHATRRSFSDKSSSNEQTDFEDGYEDGDDPILRVDLYKNDNLDRLNWRLIYRNRSYHDRETQFLFLEVLITTCGVITLIYVLFIYPEVFLADHETFKQHYNAPILLSGIVSAFLYLLGKRWRRVRLHRIYERIGPVKEGGDFCLIPISLPYTTRKFFFDKRQIQKTTTEQDSILAPFLGNFKLNGRPFLLRTRYFSTPHDYNRFCELVSRSISR